MILNVNFLYFISTLDSNRLQYTQYGLQELNSSFSDDLLFKNIELYLDFGQEKAIHIHKEFDGNHVQFYSEKSFADSSEGSCCFSLYFTTLNGENSHIKHEENNLVDYIISYRKFLLVDTVCSPCFTVYGKFLFYARIR
ncbi:hypothetical protein RF11_06697 [Thelohanellus kitauei]|uniref:Uncharacterized protein n=1 Tax=Thelohanellus kitauei TaxID=669202 RepID=A0A0C2J9L9_THEKT|nr:hypothetical protein RF11_06697 [Thelohanellus kitauei]